MLTQTNALKVELTTLSRKIAKQFPVMLWPSIDQIKDMTPIGTISRNAIEEGSREFLLVTYNDDYALVPVAHFQRSDWHAPHIYLT